MKIKFGTDGWRAIIAKEYTVDNVRRVAMGTALYMKAEGMKKVLIGYDCRFGGQMFSEQTAVILAKEGIQVTMAKDYVSTPMVSFATVYGGNDLGIVITASHNPPEYNGYKLKSKYGGPSIPSEISEVEALIPDFVQATDDGAFAELLSLGMIQYHDIEGMYIQHVQNHFDMDAIYNSKINLVYDGMYGAGQNAMRILFPNATLLHCEFNPSFYGQAPEPIDRNLKELSNYIKEHPAANLGLANDGDADRIGMYDEDGSFVDSHHLLLLLLDYLAGYKKMTGDVVITFSVTGKMKDLAKHYNLPCEVTKIGFKYIAEIMRDRDVLVGGEESGGLAVKGHIPERDGIWVGLIVMEYMAKTGKSIKELIADVYAKVGPFAFDRYDLHISNELKARVIENCANDASYTQFGGIAVDYIERLDGVKYYLKNGGWLMIRPSGTEPVLRVYCEAENHPEVIRILDDAKDQLLNS